MMRISYLILTHKNPLQLERLIIALKHPSFFFYIHVDKKTSIQPFDFLRKYNNVFFIKNRAKIFWAGYGTIQATINGIKEMLQSQYDYINVISAQDFPLKPADDIYKFFSDNNGKQFITCKSVQYEWKEADIRIKKYHFINWRIPGRFRLEKIANSLLPERKFPLNFTIVGRSNWFSVTCSAAKYLIEFIDSNPRVIKFFKYSWGADEIIFSTIIYNSQYKNKIEDNLVYVDWSEGKARPKILTKNDYENLKSSDKLFARKFDILIDAVIIELLEKQLLRN